MSTLPVARPTHWLLGRADDAPALVTERGAVSYAGLLQRVAARRDHGVRRLRLLEVAPTVDFVVDYLAALADGHPVLLLAEGDLERHAHLAAEYVPDSTGELHPDLALLLSTSGSTGSPKLVRLSRDNLLANARSIADYLDLLPGDVGVTTLPLHYCYGLSVLHSHLLAGASVVLTDLSVSRPAFWDLVRDHGVTGVAGVAHTYALLDAIGFGTEVLPSLPHLRYLTQAGGRMAPAVVREYAELAGAHGIDLFVMYGQTEATARMAYVPPELVVDHPDVIGVPIPGGHLRIDGDGDVGELVYSGPNVMLGYAHRRADLARGAEHVELRTGDLARLTPEGMFQVVGRLDRQAKVLGHRVDLDRVETVLSDAGLPARVIAEPEVLWVFTLGDRPCERARARDTVSRTVGLHGAAVRVVAVDRLPLTAAGKPDDGALRTHIQRERAQTSDVAGPVTATEIRDLLAVALGRPGATVDDSFVALGGDSLSHVEVSTRLAARLGELPTDWPSMSAGELASRPAAARRSWVSVDVSTVLRALAILLVVVSHADLAQLQGGAHVLLAVAGYNLARFQLRGPDPTRAVLRSTRAIAVPSALFVGALALLGRDYDWPTALLLNSAVGSDRWDAQWHFWFLEALVWSLVALALLLAVPVVRRALDRDPFGCSLALLAGALAVRFAWTGVTAGDTERYTAGVVVWCLALGLCAGAATTGRQRLLVAALTVIATYGFFGDVRRETLVVLGVLLLVAGRPARLPAVLVPLLRALAAASLWIYLTHWQIYRPLEDAGHPVWAVVASAVVGVAVHEVVRRTPLVGPGWRVARSRA